MTRILVLSDIHGNYPALLAVAAQAGAEGCKYILNCGDCTVYAPFANQVLTWLERHRAISIRGNTDDKVIKLLKGKDFKKPGKPEKRIMYTHTAETLTPENITALIGLKKKRKVEVAGRRIEMFHGSPAKHTEFLFADTPDERFKELAKLSNADIILTGHSHTPYHKIINGTHFINPGSVGRMFDGLPQASYAILKVGRKRMEAELNRCAYDIEMVVAGLNKARLPAIYEEMYRRGRKLN